MKRIRLMAVQLLQKENADPTDPVESFLLYTNKTSNAEIQEGRQKWQENEFCEMSPRDSAEILRVKNFVEITLSRSVSDINRFYV